MICHTAKLIFIHQRKCAGTAIIRSFGLKSSQPEWHYLNNGVLDPEFPDRPKGYRIFAVVRNPWDRFVSGWQYCERTKHQSLEETLRNLPAEGHDYRHLTRPQHVTLYHADGTPAFNELLRFETLQQDFDAFCDRVAVPRRTLPRINVGQRGAYRTYFDATTRRLFDQQFGRDAELFGYTF